jgi:hypothetical protein
MCWLAPTAVQWLPATANVQQRLTCIQRRALALCSRPLEPQPQVRARGGWLGGVRAAAASVLPAGPIAAGCCMAAALVSCALLASPHTTRPSACSACPLIHRFPDRMQTRCPRARRPSATSCSSPRSSPRRCSPRWRRSTTLRSRWAGGMGWSGVVCVCVGGGWAVKDGWALAAGKGGVWGAARGCKQPGTQAQAGACMRGCWARWSGRCCCCRVLLLAPAGSACSDACRSQAPPCLCLQSAPAWPSA